MVAAGGTDLGSAPHPMLNEGFQSIEDCRTRTSADSAMIPIFWYAGTPGVPPPKAPSETFCGREPSSLQSPADGNLQMLPKGTVRHPIEGDAKALVFIANTCDFTGDSSEQEELLKPCSRHFQQVPIGH
jgi:hypothetical protein